MFAYRRIVVVVCLGVLSACRADSSSDVDAGFTCPSNQKECVDNQLARVCPADGSGWISKPCSGTTACFEGECVQTTPICQPGEGVCTSDTSGLRCKADGKGYESVTCPTGTACTGPGLCEGSCIVDSSICVDLSTVATCKDGKTYESQTCTATERCVRTSGQPFEQAACKPAECTPDPEGCDRVCGNRTLSPTDADAGWISWCVETAEGYKWTATGCPTGKSCSPRAGACGLADARSEAACVGQCIAGETRCTTDGTAIESCGPDGKWSADLEACASGTFCALTPSGPRRAVCAEPVCALAWATGFELGSCSADGYIRHCADDGHLGVAEACGSGRCQALTDSPLVGTVALGVCTVECLTGDSECLVSGLRRVCTPTGTWSAPVQCTDGKGTPVAQCTQLTAPVSGRPRGLCGDAECAPGASQCPPAAAGPQTMIQYCTNDGHWGIAMECVGFCKQASSEIATCVAECIPSTPVCVGDPVKLDGQPLTGRSHTAMCSDKGRIPMDTAWTKCGPDATCRTTLSGTVLGCVECVGGQNEFGLVDTRCGSMQAVQTCQADNTWGDAIACGGTKVCVPPSNASPASAQLYCHGCGGDWPDSVPCTNDNRIALTGAGCLATVSCPRAANDSTLVGDCCAEACTSNLAAVPTPAYCVEPD